MSAPVVEPSACTWCAIARRGHGRQYADAVGYHAWAQPSQEQILARMKARRLAVTVAREGAVPVPVPVGPEPQGSDVAAEQLDFLHRVTLPELRREVQHHQDGKARWRKRAETAEARVAELEAERHSTNEALDDAVQALRARPVVPEREPEFHGALHHAYRLGHDLPETGGTQ